jgi:hypothetical protein
VIADGVHQGYLEVRVAMATKKGQRVNVPGRPWRKVNDGPRPEPLVALAGLAQRPGGAALAPIPHPSPDAPFTGNGGSLVAKIEAGRQAAVAAHRARIH